MILEILSLIGAVCLFLYGMRQISDSLQKMSGRRMRRAINRLTNTRLRGYFSGFFLTSLIQTSSASTLLIVSLVNAGVISLLASVPMIIGANLGTTVKLWIISFFGFQFDLGPYALLLLAAGFPFLFFKSGKLKNIGEFIIGLSLLFLGLFYMKSVFPEADEHSYFYEWVQNTTQSGFSGILFFILLGFTITAIIQSSSASITLTFVLCFQGVISFPIAVALILGQNIGTTVTVNIGALVGDTETKRAALSHLLMNLITVLLLLPFFNVFTVFSQNAVYFLFHADVSNPHSIPIGLAFVHTIFNLILGMVMLPFVKLIIQLTELIIPEKKRKKQKLTLLEDNFFPTPEMSVIHAKSGIVSFADQITGSLNLMPLMLIEKKDRKFSSIIDKINESKECAARSSSEITDYLSRISEHEISPESSRLILKFQEITDNIESISDQIFHFAGIIEMKNQRKAWFSQKMRDILTTAIQMIIDSAEIMKENISDEFNQVNIQISKEKHDGILLFLASASHSFSSVRSSDEVPPDSLICFNQLISALERISKTNYNITRVIARNPNGSKLQ